LLQEKEWEEKEEVYMHGNGKGIKAPSSTPPPPPLLLRSAETFLIFVMEAFQFRHDCGNHFVSLGPSVCRNCFWRLVSQRKMPKSNTLSSGIQWRVRIYFAPRLLRKVLRILKSPYHAGIIKKCRRFNWFEDVLMVQLTPPH
jgi:hypothetical protein